MFVNTKLIKGYFLWSIPFFILACNNGPVKEAFLPPDPKNCEWYVKPAKEEPSGNNSLGLYALRFYPDGQYTLCADLLFEQGKWSFDAAKKILLLTPSEKTEELTERYLLDEKLDADNTQFSFFSSFPIDKSDPDEFIKVVAVTNLSKSDPYKKEMHQWRKAPAQAENDDQLKQRVLAYLQFLQAFYQHAADNNLEEPSGNWYPQPILFYSNKVRMAYENELSDWYTCFFTKEEAVKGYQLISGALRKVKIEGEDDLSRNINCVEQLLKNLQQ
jgi:hypothetical protein